jgi:hypothetical protein
MVLRGNGWDARDRMENMGIWLGYTCATMYDFHEHKHFRFGDIMI